jgi:flagellar P-ring protein precursor FlgI
MSMVENLEVQQGNASAKIVINSRTGTIVIGQNVLVQPAAVTHGGLTVTISENIQVSQPSAFTAGQTAITPSSQINIEEGDSRMFVFNPGVSLDEIVRAVNQVGAAPGDLMAILEALKQAGALNAELVII